MKKKDNMKSKNNNPVSTSKNVTTAELKEMFLEEYRKKGEYMYIRTNDKSIPFSNRSGDFAHLDTTINGLILRLKLSEENPKLLEMKGLWKKCENKIGINHWDGKVVDVPINDANKMNEYLSLFDLAKSDNYELRDFMYVTE